jgi:hypothetical protein
MIAINQMITTEQTHPLTFGVESMISPVARVNSHNRGTGRLVPLDIESRSPLAQEFESANEGAYHRSGPRGATTRVAL